MIFLKDLVQLLFSFDQYSHADNAISHVHKLEDTALSN